MIIPLYYNDDDDNDIDNDLSIYLGRFPQFGGVADNTKETNKNNGGFTPFFQQ